MIIPYVPVLQIILEGNCLLTTNKVHNVTRSSSPLYLIAMSFTMYVDNSWDISWQGLSFSTKLSVETAKMSKVKEFLGPSFRFAWFIGVPEVRVWQGWRVAHPVIFVLFLFGLNCYSIATEYMRLSRLGSNDAGCFFIADIALFISNVTLMVVWVMQGARNVHETVVSLVAIDEDMKGFKFSGKSEFLGGQQPWLLVVQVFISTAMIICTTILTFSTRQTTPSGVLTAWILYAIKINVSRIQLVIADIILSHLIHQIRIRFQRINNALCEMGNIFDGSLLMPSRLPFIWGRGREIMGLMNRPRLMKSQVEKVLVDVNFLCQMHKSFCDIATELNCAFWPYLVCTLLVTVPLCMQNAFVLAVTKFTQYENPLNRYVIIAFHFLAFVQIIVKSWMIVTSCDDLAAEANKFGIMLHRIDIFDPRFNQQLRELSVKQCQNKFTMSAGGLFPINISFITYIFCPVTAYTVFVYQLNN